MSVVTETQPTTTTVLWVDDQIAAFGAHIEDLEENGYAVIAVATPEEALSTIRRGNHLDAILVDLKMPDTDGIELLQRIYSEVADPSRTRIVALSSYLYDRTVRSRLVSLNMNVALLEKMPAEGGSSPLVTRIGEVLASEDVAPPPGRQFVAWDREAKTLDPFDISFEAYLESPLVVRTQLDQKAQLATRDARAHLARKGIAWSLFCGSSETPVRTATHPADIPSDEEVFRIASGTGHPPYEFFEEGQFEEYAGAFEEHAGSIIQRTAGAPYAAGCPGDPDYPYFRISVVHRHGDVSLNRSRDFHFDSGLDMTAFGLGAAIEIGLNVDTRNPAKVVKYAGREHVFYAVSGEAYVERGDHGSLEVTIIGRAYPDWTCTPFSRQCAEFKCSEEGICFRRHALLGRNLLVENELELDLRRVRSL
jgi:CheY-like chemotaxis protein